MIRLLMFMFAVMCLFPLQSGAQEPLRVAVAANFIEPFGDIASRFGASTGISTEPVFSSTGTLFAQIVEGAPYDVFLAADEQRPRALFDRGMAGRPFVYARGQVVLWTARKELCATPDWRALVSRRDVKRVAIANTETSPYGAAAMAALKDAGLWGDLQGKLVFPQDVAQAFQYASSGSVDAGFCPLSAALSARGRAGCLVTVDGAPEVVQAACVVKRTARRDHAERFAAFLASPEAGRIKMKYGYR